MSASNAETWVWSLGWEDPLEKEMATHSSILAWRIPWTEEPGGLQSTGSQRVGHDWATSLHFSHVTFWKQVPLRFVARHPDPIRKEAGIGCFVLVSLALGHRSKKKKILLWFLPKSVLPMFSARSFMIPGLAFRSLIHFEFIFVYGVTKFSSLILLHMAVQFSKYHLLKKLSFLHCILLSPLS